MLFREPALSTPKILINLSRIPNKLIDFNNNYRLSVILCGLIRARKKNGDLYLCTLPPKIAEEIELTQLNEAINIFEDGEDALNGFEMLEG